MHQAGDGDPPFYCYHLVVSFNNSPHSSEMLTKMRFPPARWQKSLASIILRVEADLFLIC